MSRRAAWLLSAVVLVAGSLGVAPAARADTCSTTSSTGSCSIDLTVTNGSTGEPAGYVYGTVTLTLNSNGTITFDVQATSGWGFHNADFGFNMASPTSGTISVVSGSLSYTIANGSPGVPSFTNNLCGSPVPTDQGGCYGVMDGFGSFDAGFTGGNGTSNNYSNLTFTIQTSASGGFTSLSDLIAGNGTNSSNFFVGQLAQISSGCTGFVGNTGSAGGTGGFGSSCTPVTTPEPTAGGMLAMGLIGVGGVGLAWRRRRDVVA